MTIIREFLIKNGMQITMLAIGLVAGAAVLQLNIQTLQAKQLEYDTKQTGLEATTGQILLSVGRIEVIQEEDGEDIDELKENDKKILDLLLELSNKR